MPPGPRMLTRDSREIERRIGSYQAAMARYEARGDADYARWVRRQIRIEQQDRQILEWMTDNLRRRFTLRDQDEVSPPSRRGPGGSQGVSGSGPQGVSVCGAGSANALPLGGCQAGHPPRAAQSSSRMIRPGWGSTAASAMARPRRRRSQSTALA